MKPLYWFLAFLVGVIGFIGQNLLITANLMVGADKLANIGYIQIVYAIIFDIYIFDETIDNYSWIGLIIILTTVVFLL